MTKSNFACAAFLALVSIGYTPADAASRVALVIGNSDYKNFTKLTNPSRDAAAVQEMLEKAGFTVYAEQDATKQSLERSVRRFLGELENADVGLFYYAGHAVQVNKFNYIIPVDAKLKRAIDLDFEAFNLTNLQEYMEKLAKTRLIFLDACRDNPFAGLNFDNAVVQTRSAAGVGLAGMKASKGTLVAYSTAPGQVAEDGRGKNSPFTAAFVKHGLTPGMEVSKLLKVVRNSVSEETKGSQTPWENSALFTDFYFVDPVDPPEVAALSSVYVTPDGGAVQLDVAQPVQKAGGNIKIVLEEVPAFGQLRLNGDQLAVGTEMNGSDLTAIEFDAANAKTGEAGVLRYRVEDDFNNKVSGMVALIVKGSSEEASDNKTVAKTEDQEKDAEQSLIAAIRERFSKPTNVTLGVGAVPIQVAMADLGLNKQVLRVDEIPISGHLTTQGRDVSVGQYLSDSDIENLKFRPALNVDVGQHKLKASLNGKAVDISLKVEVDQCDLDASEPLDLQGVAPGKLSNEIDVAKAKASCTNAVVSHPEIGRFYFQLARAELADGNVKTARELLEVAKLKGHIRASYLDGLLHLRGAYGKADMISAFGLFEDAAEKGDPFAMHSLGKQLFKFSKEGETKQRALALMLKSAEMGHTYAMNELGWIFGQGKAVEKDPERMLAFFSSSVLRNDIYGLNNMGLAYLNGNGVEKNSKLALELFLRSANGGHPFAPNNVARMYLNGNGVEKDISQAALWFGVSADRGNPWAANSYAQIEQTGQVGKPNLVLAAKYYGLAAAFDRKGPSDDAIAALKIMDKKSKTAAINLVISEIYGSENSATAYDDNKEKALADMKSYGIAKPKGTQETLLAMTRLKWLKSKPRFDLF